MDRKTRSFYVDKIMPVLGQYLRKFEDPIALDAGKLLREALRQVDYPYPFGPKDASRIVHDLSEELVRRCLGEECDDIFPAYVIKNTSRIISAVGHGKPLVVHSEESPDESEATLTARFYRRMIVPSSTSRYTGFAVFRKDVPKSHPILLGQQRIRSNAIKSEAAKLNKRLDVLRHNGWLDASDVKSLQVQSDESRERSGSVGGGLLVAPADQSML
jgi:hypothetical protein